MPVRGKKTVWRLPEGTEGSGEVDKDKGGEMW